ncbi:hypothetical protein DUNSADRAFT_1772 [Dunaliella salina]|uniref:Uncharacterized protein n=1 Tax=Dunaliella salina TaxID=3046 RepID=A0ABQ7FX17_DUNSA|nr:hypothetical protein DUNSADRAFT_1772 [Dunaliella salina]|eukprot:KAF5826904.1 hypothetical protein DUNSADRAFT_1772 [Dunaliella salina]
MGGVFQDLPRLSCQDLGRMMQAYPAKAGSLVHACQSSSHFFGTGLNAIVTRVDALFAPLAAGSQAAQQPSSFRDLLPPQAFASALAPCSKDTLDDVYDAASRSTKQKLPVVAVACANKKECAAALSAISSAAHSRHTKHIDGGFFDGPGLQGHLQNHVASFFKFSPYGILIVERLEHMSHECLVVMKNAMSENGNLQQDGYSVSTSGGLGIFILQLPGATPACSADLESKVKNKLHRAAAVAEGVEANKSIVGKTLRRRIDFVVSAAELPESA